MRTTLSITLATVLAVPWSAPGGAAATSSEPFDLASRKPPVAGCWTTTDPAGDVRITGNDAGKDPDGSDDDLDLLGIAAETTETHLVLWVAIGDLAAKPARADGHRFSVGATAASSATFQAHVESVADGTESARLRDAAGIERVVVKGTAKKSGGSEQPIEVAALLDQQRDWVVFAISRASLGTVFQRGVAEGDKYVSVQAYSDSVVADRITPVKIGDSSPVTQANPVEYVIGDNRCFPPPATTLRVSAPRVQYGDVATLTATLTFTEGGGPVAGRPIAFTVGSPAKTARTGSDGVARLAYRATRVGNLTVGAAFAGDHAAAAVTAGATLSVVRESTRLALAVTRRSGRSRTVTATLTDDDRSAVAGQVVTWYVNGRRAATGRTDSRGRASYGKAVSGQTVEVRFGGTASAYLAARSVRVRV